MADAKRARATLKALKSTQLAQVKALQAENTPFFKAEKTSKKRKAEEDAREKADTKSQKRREKLEAKALKAKSSEAKELNPRVSRALCMML